jgi:hypothetical protein
MAYMKTNGFHYGPGGNATGSKEFALALDAAGIPVIAKSTDSTTGIYDLQEIMRSSIIPHVPVFRLSTSGQGWIYDFDVPRYDLDPHSAALIHWNETKARIPKELDPELTWIEVINEVDKNRSEWLALFAQHIATVALRDGYKILMFGWSSGEPDPAHWAGKEMINFLRMCAAQPERLGIAVHEYDYGHFGPEDPRVAWWHYGRYQDIHAVCDQYGILRPTIVVTEWGWSYQDVPPQVVDWSEKASRLYYNEPNVLGCALWYLGPGFGGIANKLNPFMMPLKDRILSVELDDKEPPVMKHKAIVVKLPQDMTIEEWVEASANAFEYRHTITASHDDMLTVLRGGNSESYVKFTHPIRDGQAIALVEAAGYRWEPFYDDGPLPPPIEPGEYLVMDPLLSQRDGRWGNATIGEPTGHGRIIAGWGCLLVAYNMQAHYFGLTDAMPDAFNSMMVNVGAFNGPFLRPGALAMLYPGAIDYQGFKTRDNSTMRSQIRQWIDNGWPVPCRVDFDPTDSDFDQHWVLVVGYQGDTDFWMADPWHGDVELVNNRYPIAGSDILEALFYAPSSQPPPPPQGDTIDLVPLMFPADRRVYEVRHPDGSQERIQTQVPPGQVAYIVKGENQGYWEQWEWDNEYIYLVRDTSPARDVNGKDVYYEVKKGANRSPWIKRHMRIGETFSDGGHVVTFKYKSNCQPNNDPRSGNSSNQTALLSYHDTYTFPSGLTFQDVVFIRGNTEIHAFALGIGRVYWEAPWGTSYISELHSPGARPDITREVIGCL